MSLTARNSSSLVIDRLCDQVREEDLAVAWLYCDYNAQQEQTVINLMGAIVKQLVGRGDIPKDIREAFQEGKKVGGRRPLLVDLMRMLRIAIVSFPQVFICVDALDECLPKDLPKLLESLRDIIRECPGTRILLTGRPHVGEAIQRYFTKAVTIPISPNEDDIRNYVVMRLDSDDMPEAMNDSLRAEIVRIILDKMSNMYVGVSLLSMMYTYYQPCRFLLASLNIEAVLGGVTIRERRKKLNEMAGGNGLSDAYTATLKRLREQKGNKSVLGLRALMWVSHSERPLVAEELRHALGVEIGSTDLDGENVPELRTLLSSCLGLLTVEASSSTIRLVHFTLQEHLLSDPTLFHNPHSTMAEACLTYLNFGSVKDLSPTLRSAPSTMPFLEYASVHWGAHTRREITEDVKTLALRLLDRFDEHISAQLLLLRYKQYNFLGPRFGGAGGPVGFTGLHGVAYLGIVEVVAAVLEMREWDINASDGTGSTALTWAACKGREEVVKMLLERKDVNPDQVDTEYGWTPLSLAAEGGHEGVVKILLERKDANPNHADTFYGRTPLSWAAQGGHEGVVKILLERNDVNPDHADTFYGQTPLSLAAEGGHEGVVKILLERKDVNPDHADTKYGQTPLSLAAGGGHEGALKILLERKDVNPDQADTKYGRTPLSLAAQGGHEGALKILLERKDVNPDHADTKYGQTPLSLAAERGREGVVKILLERKDVNPDQADTFYGQTPLSLAAERGREGVVKILLERKDVNPDHADTDHGQTPLSLAAERGREGVVKILLERNDVNPDHADTLYGRTPLSLAAEGGHEGVVKILLERKDVNPDQADTFYGQTPLSLAAEGGHEGVVKILLERKDVNPDQADTKYGRTPLSFAAQGGHEGVVKILLERKDVNPDHAETFYGQTPLSLAAERGREGVVKILLERKDVNPDQADTYFGRTPLSWAAQGGHEGVVKILLERKDVNPDHADTFYGQTPLSLAAGGGHEGVVKILLEGKDAALLDSGETASAGSKYVFRTE